MLDYITNTHFKVKTLKNLFAFIFLFILGTVHSYAAIASWYGPNFHGKRTANGEIYNQNALTGAHNSIPFGTNVCLTNIENGKTVTIKTKELGFLKQGTCKVTYKICN
jgi:hypothetical protein